MRHGPAPDERYQRLNPGAVARRRSLAVLPVAALRDYCEDLLWEEFRAGRLPNARAIPSLAHVMALALKHGAYAIGIVALAALIGVSPRTVIRGSKRVRERRISGQHGERSFLWRRRGRKGEGVTLWQPGHALVDAVIVVRAKRRRRHEASLRHKADQAQLRQAIRDTNAHKGSRSQCDTVAQVAAPGRPEGKGGGDAGRHARFIAAPAAKITTPEPDIPDTAARCQHGRHAYACLACALIPA